MGTVRLYVGYFLNHLFNDIITHIPIHGLRKAYLRLFNAHIHSTAVILMHTRILNFWNLKVGASSIINQHVVLDCRKYAVIIHEQVDIGPYTKIWTLSHDPHHADHATTGGDVIIQHHAWIASSVTILPDVCIEAGAVVAAGAVVTKSVPAKHIVGGIPAVKIGERNNALNYSINYNPIFE